MRTKRTLLAACIIVLLLMPLPLLGTGGHAFSALPSAEEVQDVRGPTRAGVPNMDANISYAIITDFRFAPLLEPLKRMKTEKGVKAEIYQLNESTGILYNYYSRGIDDAQRIHEFLRDLEKLNPDLEWVLLVGDHEIIPSRRVYLNGTISTNYKEEDDSGFRQYTYSDYYYAGLDTAWNSDPDQKPIIWGEEGEADWTPNVYVGRLPVSTVAEAQRAVQNILDYELDPPPGYWYKSHLTYAALMDTPNLLSFPAIPDLAYQSYKDNGYEVALKVKELTPEYMTDYVLYDYNKIPGGDYSPFFDTLNHTNAQHYWNLGNSLVTIASHGYSDGDALLHYQGDGDMYYGPQTTFSFFDYEDAYDSKNGGMLPLVYGSACGVGNFTESDDTNMERLLYAPQGGAIGVIMASSESTYRCEFEENDSSYGNWWLVQEFWRLFFDEAQFRPGKALYDSKVNYDERIKDPLNPHKEYPYKTLYKTNKVAYNLLGDPEVPVWTDVPQELNVSHPRPLHINNHSAVITVADAEGAPVENALVCIYGEDIYLTALTPANGTAVIPLDLNRTMSFNITVTAHNFLRWTGRMDVVSVMDIAVAKNSFIISKEHPSAGETISVSVNITNQGSVKVKDLRIDFLTGPAGAQTGLLSFTKQTLEPGESRRYIAPWKVVSGTTTITVSVDPENKLFEFNEENNLGSVAVTDNKPVRWLQDPWVNITEDSQLMDHPDRLINLLDFGLDSDKGPEPLAFSIVNVSEPDCNCSLVTASDEEVFLNVIPPKDWTGVIKITLSVSDGATSDLTEVTVLVEEVPDPPRFPPPQRVFGNESEWVQLEVWAFDVDSDDLVFNCSSETLNVTLVWADNGSVKMSFIADNDQVGDHIITVTARDGTGLKAATEIPVTVLNVNTPPFILPLEKNGFTREVGDEFLLYIKAGDDDNGDELRFSDDTDLFDINSSTGAIRFTPAEQDVGTRVIWITVADENGTTARVNITLKITQEKFEGNSYTILILFVLCVIVIVVLTMFLQSRRKEAPPEADGDEEDEKVPISIREWSSRDSDVEAVVEEYSWSGKGLRGRNGHALERTEPKALPPAKPRAKRKKMVKRRKA